MPVYVALFGEQNYEWLECLSRNTIATPNDVESFGFWQSRDKESYVQHHVRRGVPKQTASRWFNTKTIFSESVGDIWLHKDGTRVWWTRTTEEPPEFIEKTEPVGHKQKVIICHKPCEPWRSVSEIGTELLWKALHPKARDILNTRITLQRISDEDEAYILALLQGEDLSPWHAQPEWRAQAGPGWTDPDAGLSALDRAVSRMAQMAFETAAQSNGQKVMSTRKNKNFGFADRKELQAHLTELLEKQGGKCALSGLQLCYDGPDVDRELRPSLDRISSDGHYEQGNLQVVTHFINRWKGAYDNGEFQRLLKLLRG